MRIGAVLSPVDDWQRVVEGARAADELGFDSVSFWDHYHSPRPEWGYVCGWAAYGYLAAVTRDVRFVSMVLNALHYQLGVLAKESSMLSIASGGRFELGIGAGDWPESFAAWGHNFPSAVERLARLDGVRDAPGRLRAARGCGLHSRPAGAAARCPRRGQVASRRGGRAARRR